MLRKIIYAVSGITLAVLGKFLLGGDYLPFLQWWATVLCLGLIFLPLTDLIFDSFEDRGYLFSKTIGIAISGYLMWLLSSLRILRFSAVHCLLTTGLCLAINLAVMLIRYNRSRRLKAGVHVRIHRPSMFHKDTMELMIMEELLFFGIFLLFIYIRGFKPEAYGTEKFMDYGFMTTMNRTDYMPPKDFWFAGTTLNYYYVGQFMATFLSKLSFVGTAKGYNLMLMMTGAFTFVLPFSIAYHLMLNYRRERSSRKGVLPALSGVLAGLGVCLAGNMHYPIFKWVLPFYQKNIQKSKEIYRYWFPDATRYIGYHPETTDKTIHEFPAYSFVLGDLHAHVINLLFVITVLGILLAWLLGRREKKIIQENPKEDRIALIKEVFHPSILMLGFFIGLFHTTNFWDYPIYYVVSGAVILFSNLIVYNFKGKAYLLTAFQGILILVLGEIICLPFTLNFNQISATPLLTVARTPIYQLAVLWGLPIATVIAFLLYTVSDDFERRRQRNKRKQQKLSNKVRNPKSTKEKALLMYMQGLNSSELFILTIGLCAIGLILLPEIVYIKDIYSGDYKRANTMFKLTYQAFVLFGICFSFILIRLLAYGRTRRQKLSAGVGLFLFLLTLFYVRNATEAWYGNIFKPEGYKGIDSTAFMKDELPEDYEATKWILENIEGTPVMLEANGDSYTIYERISVITGLPTVLGWYTHERLWKSEPDVTDEMVTAILDERAADIEIIYTSDEEAAVRSLLQKYDISYIYVGGPEEKKYGSVNHELIRRLGTVVYEAPDLDMRYETYIVKVK